MNRLLQYVRLCDDLKEAKDQLHTVTTKLEWYEKNYDFLAENMNDIREVDKTMEKLTKESFKLRKHIAVLDYTLADLEEEDYDRD